MPTVFVIDDASGIPVALSRLLASKGHSVRSFASAEHFLEAHDEDTPGCILLEAVLPGMSGLELQRTLIGSRLSRPIIFLTGRGDVEITVRAMKAGAVDFLTKPVDDAQLLHAIDLALQCDGEARRNRTIHRMIDQRIANLTPRERQVMEQVVYGRLNKQIAAELGTGEKCVKVHRGRVMKKMGAGSIAQLVQLAARVGIAMDPAVPMMVSAPSIHSRVQFRNDRTPLRDVPGGIVSTTDPRQCRPWGQLERQLNNWKQT